MPWLREHLLFAALSDEQFSLLTKASSAIRLAKGDILFHHGDKAHGFFVLEAGLVQLYRLSAAGEEKVIEIIQPRQSFAEAVMFLERSLYPVSARAIVESVVLRFETTLFVGLLQQSPQLCLRLLGRMSQRLHQLIQEIDQVTLQNTMMRTARFLLQQALAHGNQKYIIQLEAPKHILASRLTVRPETFSRTLQQLERAGLIRVHGKTLEILDKEALSRLADGGDGSTGHSAS